MGIAEGGGQVEEKEDEGRGRMGILVRKLCPASLGAPKGADILLSGEEESLSAKWMLLLLCKSTKVGKGISKNQLPLKSCYAKALHFP